MKLDSILNFSHILLGKGVSNGSIAVDCTMGNGHDTLFLASLTGPTGHVYSFDIQEEAVDTTRKKVLKLGLKNQVTLFHAGHQLLKQVIPTSVKGKISGAVFNLGYLPGGDKSITTQSSTTISCLEQLLEWLAPGGIIVLVIYDGHAGGAAERDEILTYVTHLPQNAADVLHYSFINQKNNPPFIVAIEKKTISASANKE